MTPGIAALSPEAVQRPGWSRIVRCSYGSDFFPAQFEAARFARRPGPARGCRYGFIASRKAGASGQGLSRARTMSKPIERIIKTNGISLNVVEQGRFAPSNRDCRAVASGPISARHTQFHRTIKREKPTNADELAPGATSATCW